MHFSRALTGVLDGVRAEEEREASYRTQEVGGLASIACWCLQSRLQSNGSVHLPENKKMP
jgi:hypothetical protein